MEFSMPHRSFGELCDAVEALTGDKTAGAALSHVKNGYELTLLGIDPRDAHVHTWSFLQPVADLAILANITGTAKGVYDAGTDLTTITATTDIFVASQVGDTIAVTAGGGVGVDLALVIASYTSSKVVVANAGNAFDAKAVSLPHTGIYTLPADFGGLVEAPAYPYPSGAAAPEWREESVEEIFEMWRHSKSVGTACRFALVALPQVSGAKQTWAIVVAPKPAANRVLRYRYVIDAPAAADSATAYPLGGPLMGLLYEAAALADAEMRTSGNPGRWAEKYALLMAGCIDRDKTLFETDGPTQMADG
jgi:hypothetical protein